MSIELPYELPDANDNDNSYLINILCVELGLFDTAFDHDFIVVKDATSPSISPLFLVTFQNARTNSYYIATDGEKYCELYSKTIWSHPYVVYSTSHAAIAYIIPNKQIIHRSINIYLNYIGL